MNAGNAKNDCKDCAGCINCKCNEANAIQEYVNRVVKQLEQRSTLARPVGWSKAYEIIKLEDAIETLKEIMDENLNFAEERYERKPARFQWKI